MKNTSSHFSKSNKENYGKPVWLTNRSNEFKKLIRSGKSNAEAVRIMETRYRWETLGSAMALGVCVLVFCVLIPGLYV